MAPTVPYTRQIHVGTQGLDVVATKRALSRAGFLTWGQFTQVAGDGWRKGCVGFQQHAKIKADGVYGPVTHEKLVAARRHGAPGWAFDDVAIQYMKDELVRLEGSKDERVRSAIVSAGYFWYAHRLQIAYSESRPFETIKPPQIPSRWDCSAFVTSCHFAGGAPNPNGRPWDGLGYTGTLLSTGTRCEQADLKPGDLVFYGYTTNPTPAFPYGSPTHVALYVGVQGNTPMVLSNGGYPMAHIPMGYRGINQFRHYNVS